MAFSTGDFVLLIDRKDRQRMIRLSEGGQSRIMGEPISHDELIGLTDGATNTTPEHRTHRLYAPTLAEQVMNMRRQATIIYPKDAGLIVVYADVFPGARVVEIGAGMGALSLFLLRAVGKRGRLYSYEIRADHAREAGKNVRRFAGDPNNYVLIQADAEAGISQRRIDRVIADVPEPWRLLDGVFKCLKPGGIFAAWLPTVLQVKNLGDALIEGRRFGEIEVQETLQRYWHLKGPSIRPRQQMVGHTGFLITARKRTAPTR
jgi:tRNA (adenine57-N1/adenine58-N1)-methyltransferase